MVSHCVSSFLFVGIPDACLLGIGLLASAILSASTSGGFSAAAEFVPLLGCWHWHSAINQWLMKVRCVCFGSGWRRHCGYGYMQNGTGYAVTCYHSNYTTATFRTSMRSSIFLVVLTFISGAASAVTMTGALSEEVLLQIPLTRNSGRK